MALKYERPIMIPFNADSGKTGVGKCGFGTGDAGNCQDGGAALGVKCGSGLGAINRCQIGESAVGSCNQGNGGA